MFMKATRENSLSWKAQVHCSSHQILSHTYSHLMIIIVSVIIVVSSLYLESEFRVTRAQSKGRNIAFGKAYQA